MNRWSAPAVTVKADEVAESVPEEAINTRPSLSLPLPPNSTRLSKMACPLTAFRVTVTAVVSASIGKM